MAREPRHETTPLKFNASVVGALLLVVAGSIEHFQFEAAYQPQNRDPFLVGMQSSRLEGIAAKVPPDAVLGYLSDAPLDGTVGKSAFRTAAYTLAPRLLVPGAQSRWVAGNFGRAADYTAIGREHGLQVVQDFGSGAVLFERSGAR